MTTRCRRRRRQAFPLSNAWHYYLNNLNSVYRKKKRRLWQTFFKSTNNRFYHWPIQRPWCGVRYTMRWCSFTPLRMVVTLRNVKCKILGYFLVKERHPLTWNPFVNNSIVNWNSSFPSWLTIVIIPLNQGWGSVSPSRILDACSLIPPTWKIWFLSVAQPAMMQAKQRFPGRKTVPSAETWKAPSWAS